MTLKRGYNRLINNLDLRDLLDRLNNTTRSKIVYTQKNDKKFDINSY